MRINWSWFCNELIDELRKRPANTRSITLSTTELLRRTGAADAEPKGFRKRSYWAGALQGRGAWRTAQRAGLSVELKLDVPGAEVQAVTFRLTEQPTTYRIIGLRADHPQEVLGNELTKDEATDLFMTLLDSRKYSGFKIERDQE